MSSIQNRLFKAGIFLFRKIFRPNRDRPIPYQRRSIERGAKLIPRPRYTTYQPIKVKGMQCEWIKHKNAAPSKVLYYLHGGAYALCSINTHRRLVAKLSKYSGAKGFAIEYRMAPEHPYPAAVEDAIKGYEFLLEHSYLPENIVIGGDSAGGGLTIALLQALRDRGYVLPKAAVLLSPWTDLEGEGESNYKNISDDAILTNPRIKSFGKLYAGEEDIRHPLLSPIYGNLNELPPLHITVSKDELLYSDAIRLYDKAKADGVEVTLSEWDDLIHVWQIFDFWLPEARQSNKEIGAFIRSQWQH